MTTRDAMNKSVPSNLLAFPSVSSSLHSLPHATSMQNVSLHPNMYVPRSAAAESEAKLQKALSKTAQQNSNGIPAYMIPPPAQSQDPSTLMIRKTKTKLQS